RDVGAVVIVVEGVVVAGVAVPADEVVGVGGVAVQRVAGEGPAALPGVAPLGVTDHRLEDVAGVDVAVVGEVGYLAGALVDRIVQAPEGDAPVVVDVHQVPEARRRYLLLVEPHVAVKVRVRVVDACIHHRDDDVGAAGGDVPGGGGPRPGHVPL